MDSAGAIPGAAGGIAPRRIDPGNRSDSAGLIPLPLSPAESNFLMEMNLQESMIIVSVACPGNLPDADFPDLGGSDLGSRILSAPYETKSWMSALSG